MTGMARDSDGDDDVGAKKNELLIFFKKVLWVTTKKIKYLNKCISYGS